MEMSFEWLQEDKPLITMHKSKQQLFFQSGLFMQKKLFLEKRNMNLGKKFAWRI